MSKDKETCMLAKGFKDIKPGWYYAQEKLDGVRSICVQTDFNTEERYARSGKFQEQLLHVFDMDRAPENILYDGEVMARGKMTTKDFARTSGLVNSQKASDKKELVYIIYDIVDEDMQQCDRTKLLELITPKLTSSNVMVLPTHGPFHYPNDMEKIGELASGIVANGGEGLMLRAVNGYYEIGKRSSYLIKFKNFQTCDLRVVGYTDGEGKHEGRIGALICRSDDGEFEVKVGTGFKDYERELDFETTYLNNIVEIKYFDYSQAQNKTTKSLRFPVFKWLRPDKDSTSMY